MSWYRAGTVAVTNGSKTVTGVGTLFTTAVNAGDAFALVDANLNPTGAWYEVESVTNNTTLVLKQSYAGSTGSNKQYCVFNLVGNMTTPSFAQRLATFFASFQSLIDKPTTTPTASSIPIADSGGKIADGWIPATVARLASPTFTGTPTAPTATKATNTTQLATTAHVKSVVADYAPLATLLGTGLGASEVPLGPADANTLVAPGFWSGRGANGVNWGIAQYGFMIVSRRVDTVFQIGINSQGSNMQLRVSTDAGATWGSWCIQYSNYNILGTVSQSGGVPTGAVIERGSNTNGEYVKFADKTMICVFNATLSSGAYTWTYPVSFAAAPQVTCLPAVSNAADLFSTTCLASPGVSSATFYGNISTNGGSTWAASSATIHMTAIGRWF